MEAALVPWAFGIYYMVNENSDDDRYDRHTGSTDAALVSFVFGAFVAAVGVYWALGAWLLVLPALLLWLVGHFYQICRS
jgi:hypothetical protein